MAVNASQNDASAHLEVALKNLAAVDRAISAAENSAAGSMELQIADLRDFLDPLKNSLISAFAAAKAEEIYSAADEAVESDDGAPDANLVSSYPDLAASLIDRGFLITAVADEMDAETKKHYAPGELDLAELTRGTEEYEVRLMDYAAALD